MNAKRREIGPVAFLVLHVFVAALLLAVVLDLHAGTLKAIRGFHPEYPMRIVQHPYMPIGVVLPLHMAGPVLLSIVTLCAIGVSVIPVLRQSSPGRANLVTLGLHVACVLAAIFIYARSATQLAGFAGVLVRGTD